MKKEYLRSEYLLAAGEYKNSEAEEDKTLLLLSVLRLACFAGGLGLVIYLGVSGMPGPAIISAFGFLILFLLLLRSFSRHSEKKELASNLAIINQNEALSLSGDISKFRPGKQFIDIHHDYSFDIDLFGEYSLFQYLNRTVTGYGEEILAGWLADPFLLSSDLHMRQEIIRELGSRRKLRQEFMASGMKIPVDRDHEAGLIRWLNVSEEMTLAKKIMIFLLPSFTIASLILLAAGILHYSVFVILILINLGFVSKGLKKTNEVHRLVSGKYEWLASLNKLLAIFGDEGFESAYLTQMQREISGEDISAASSVRKLGRIIQGFDTRLNILAGFTLNALLLWDYHCIRRLVKWKAGSREKFPGWLKIIGDIDAYSSLGNYAFNNDEHAWPVLSEKGYVLDAISLGHPLIAEEKRVCNDFFIEKRGKIGIITGANMAGKSTFLRTITVNFILAMAGAPVCAGKFGFTPVKLFTSMRTTDSLAGNESYFYAELKRLKALQSKIIEDGTVFFILDEILKGTNSADKTLGSKLFLNKLILHGATGLISTHDLTLADLEREHPGDVFNMCFEIDIDGSDIRFDYKLQKGVTRKMNAALLMRQMGILD